ncbi:hypothetical protein Ddye_030992 [Dipteronia dyeriana]|uniref:RING-type E3 ubiquitin transferase n=1 Tax=Dipteronia dyeriana TaxID=168575 RepID=A0AAD9THG1_9ROSI|nr:hypothetical protein Ddye_030992 [Dipteronia dyeriana]
MASDAESIEISSLFERLLRHRDMSLFLPFILGFTENMSVRENPENPQDPDEETPTNSSDRIILINPFTQGMVVIEGTSSLDSLLRNVLATKDGQPPASKASVEAMPSFRIDGEMGGAGGECAICLEEYEDGEMAKEMPCKHRFHDKCIDKWLGIHGSCPVCRYKMPVDEEETDNKIRDHEHEQRREIWVSFSINSGRRSGSGDSNNQTGHNAPPTLSNDDVSSSSPNSTT